VSISYQTKLSIIITLLCVVLTSLSMGMIYRISYDLMLDRIIKNLVDVGRLGSTLFDDECIAAIKRLTTEAEEERILSNEEIMQIPIGQARPSLPKEVSDHLHASADFQLLVKRLDRIIISSTHSLDLNQETFDPNDQFRYFSQGMIAPYLMVGVEGLSLQSCFKNLVSPSYEPLPNSWPGNPIGMVARSQIPIDSWNNDVYVAPGLVVDAFYTCASAMVLIKDHDGTPVAALGIDYPVGSELNKLARLRYFSYFIVLASGLLGYLLSRSVSRRMSRSLHQLRDAAQLIEQGNYHTHVEVTSHDEFDQVATAFNRMSDAIGKTMDKLASRNERLRSVTADMHDGVGSVLTNIRLGSLPSSYATLEQIHHLSGQGLEEVRFLMDALEYEDIDLNLLKEGLCLLCADLLDPHQIKWRVEFSGREEQPILFQLYLDIQRIVREALTNILKHSSSQFCVLTLHSDSQELGITIVNQGTPLSEPRAESTGRGFDNMRYRVNRHGGELEINPSENGYQLTMKFCLADQLDD